MSSKSMYEKYIRMNNFILLLGEFGYKSVDIDLGCVVAEGQTVHIYCDFSRNCMYFAKKKQFDRWANSRDYIFYGIPTNRNDMEIVLRIA